MKGRDTLIIYSSRAQHFRICISKFQKSDSLSTGKKVFQYSGKVLLLIKIDMFNFLFGEKIWNQFRSKLETGTAPLRHRGRKLSSDENERSGSASIVLIVESDSFEKHQY